MNHKRADSFVFRREYYSFLKPLPLDDYIFCFKAICDFAFDCIPAPEHKDPYINNKLKEICNRIDSDICAYQKRCNDGGK